jgi:hypothetical protein
MSIRVRTIQRSTALHADVSAGYCAFGLLFAVSKPPNISALNVAARAGFDIVSRRIGASAERGR